MPAVLTRHSKAGDKINAQVKPAEKNLGNIEPIFPFVPSINQPLWNCTQTQCTFKPYNSLPISLKDNYNSVQKTRTYKEI